MPALFFFFLGGGACPLRSTVGARAWDAASKATRDTFRYALRCAARSGARKWDVARGCHPGDIPGPGHRVTGLGYMSHLVTAWRRCIPCGHGRGIPCGHGRRIPRGQRRETVQETRDSAARADRTCPMWSRETCGELPRMGASPAPALTSACQGAA
jgi:hypothetical protein